MRKGSWALDSAAAMWVWNLTASQPAAAMASRSEWAMPSEPSWAWPISPMTKTLEPSGAFMRVRCDGACPPARRWSIVRRHNRHVAVEGPAAAGAHRDGAVGRHGAEVIVG